MLFVVLKQNTNLFNFIGETARQGVEEQADGGDDKQETQITEDDLEVGRNGYISSAQIIERVTGTGPWDDDDEPGNDSSPDNDIVRSFDQVTWTVNLTTALKEGAQQASYTGGVVEFTASLPEEYAKTEFAPYMEWDLDSMGWIEDANLSDDGIILTGKYSLSETDRTVPGAQTLVFVLKLYGVANKKEFAPTFTFNLAGNEENEKTTITDNNIRVSAKGKYNINLIQNKRLSKKVSLGLDEENNQELTGRMYGYGIILQLYNEDESKGLKGIEYPKGDITFNIETKLEKTSINNPNDVEDITSYCTPILYDYKINTSNPQGVLENDMNFGNSVYGYLKYDAPYGTILNNRNLCVYNSGNIDMIQSGNIINVKISDYSFDSIFPSYNNNSNILKYTDNIGCFSVAYFQIFVPDNEYSTDEGFNYYLTVEDKDFISNTSLDTTTIQQVTNDDIIRIQHFLHKTGNYNQDIRVQDVDILPSPSNTNGNGATSIGDKFTVWVSTNASLDNDVENIINTINKLIKFDGNAFEPYKSNENYYKTEHAEFIGNDFTYKMWFLTKKDGTNWSSQDEMNNTNIEDLVMYENYEDIPDGYICVGEYYETQTGYLINGHQIIDVYLKVKETANIGETYAITSNSKGWTEQLDRSIYSSSLENVKWPETTFEIKGNYIKTEYDENNQILTGTHNSASYGQSLLIIGANLHGDIRTIDETNAEKTNYDLGRNENIVTYSVEPALDANTNLESQIENVTLKADVTLSSGLTYVPGSSKRGEASYTEPEIQQNDDGSTTLVWYLYDVTSGDTIEPILFDAQIDNNTANNTQFETKFVVSEVIGEDGIAKVGNSEIKNRTSTTTINITNMSSYRLYKETVTPIIEANGEIKYKIVYQNDADTTVPDFQILDILPYNGDGRGTAYNGTYILKDVKVTQNGETTSLDNLKLYTTTSPDARKITPKDESIGVSEIWQEKQIGEEINEAVTVVALKGEIGKQTDIEIEITLQTANNRGGDIYYNQATAQISKTIDVIETSNVKAEVVKRQIEGTIWYDTNENGVMDEDEERASRVEVELLKADGSKAVDYNGNEIQNILTNSNGEYTFTNLPMGEYIVEIHTDDRYTLTTANVGTNREINSKFEETEDGSKQSYTITNLNGIQSPEIIEANVNAGLVVKDAKIIVKYLEEDSTPETDEDNRVLKEQDEITTYDKDGVPTKYKLGDSYTTSPAEIENYISLRNSGNTSGTLNTEETIVTYYYTYNLQDIEVTKVWEDNHDTAQKRPTSIKVTLKDGAEEVKEITLNSSNLVESAQAGIEGIRDTAEVWQGTIEDVPVYNEAGQRISYTIDEKENEGTLDSYNKTINGMVITNTFTQNTEKIEIPVTKVWEDSDNKARKRPESLTLILKREVGSSYVEASRATINAEENQGSNSNEWTYIFTDIAKYDENNNEIKYVVEEETPEFYTSIVENVENTEEGQDTIAFRITNTFEVPEEKVSYEVTKIWNDNNNRAGKRPEEVTLVLTGKNPQGDVVVEGQEITLTKADAIDGNTEGSTDTSTTWKGTIENLPKYDENADIINYELSEEKLNNIFYTEANTTIDQQSKIVTNRFEVPDNTIDIEVTKVWNDSNNAEGVRPESVTLYLTGNGQENEITLTKANAIDGNTEGETDTSSSWKGTITDLPKYDVNGNEINYVLDERPVTSEFYTKTNIDQGTKTVTNTFGIPTENIQITVTKIWEDNNNALGKRPENITLQIKNKATGEIVASQLMQGSSTSKDGWSYTFEVPKYAGSTDEVEYEIAEADLNNIFYTAENAEINQETRTITNRFAIPDEEIELPVRKEWNHTNNNYKIPQEVKIQVKDETGAVVAEQILNNKNQTEENVWEYTFTGLKKYNEQAEEKKYTIDEEAVTPGDLDYYRKEIDGTTIKNTYIGPIISAEKTAEISTTEGTPVTDREYVIAGETITYTITVKNDGGLSKDVVIKDTIPTGTTFISGSIEISNNENTSNLGETELESGITVNVPAKVGEETGTTTLSFKVTVQDLENGTEIKNIATVDGSNTNETTNTYLEPIISMEKTQETENKQDYVVEGEKITYTITVKNDGGLATDVKIQDTIPEGTSFVEGSIKINGQARTELTQDSLVNGITESVTAKDGEVSGTLTVSFEVTVDELATGIYTRPITNTATVDETLKDTVQTTVKKAYITATKESEPESASTVTAGNEITYRIKLDNTLGTIEGDILVQDSVPEGTTYVENSLKLNGEETEISIEDLENGETVTVPAGESSVIEFKVTVNDLNNGQEIRNIAYTGEEKTPTEEITHRYIEPIIEATKTQITEHDLDYVVEGEKITYTITVTNNGGLDDNAIIKDTAPTGTTFVPGSIKINGSGDDNYTEGNLNSGIEVNVPAKVGEVAGTATVSFEVTVNELTGDTYKETIRNTAIVNEEDTNEVTIEVKKPHIVANKTSDPANGTEVTQGNEITYYINVNNDGEAPTTVTVKDSIPLGTTFKEGSIKVEGSSDTYELADLTTTGIEIELDAKEDKTVEFTVTVNDLNNGADITNIATVDDEQTNTVTHEYVEATINATKTQTTENSLDYVVEGETITYTITVTNTGDLAKRVTVKDVIPTGTSFVENSIKIDNQEQTYTQTDLQNGINVDVPAKGNVVVTFEVTVNELVPDTYEGTITNKANVDGKDTNEVTEEVKKPHVTGVKTSTPASGSTVKQNDPITYVITLTNDGTAPETVTVRDEIPDGTTFTDGSIKVQGDGKTYTIDDLTTYGINVTVPAGETRTVEFVVTVNDLDNGDKITNIAYVEGEETDSVEHTYVEAIIDGSKASETENGLDYVVEGEIITYTITASNTGDLDKNITISDQIPEGTTFVPGSIKVNGQERADLAQTNLESGIQVNVPARTSEEQAGTASLSFQVTVNPLDEGIFYKEIENTAIVDGKSTEPVENVVNKSDVKATKTSVPESESTVKAGETITYTINLTNDGTALAEVTVKDEIPEGTTFKAESIKVNGEGRTDLDEADLESGIQVTVPAKVGEEVGTGTVSFEVTVNDNEDGQEIKNKATVNETPTNETIHKYVEPVITQEKSATTEHGLDYAVEGEKITYTITVTNNGGLEGNVIVKDEAPEGTTFVEGSIKVNGLPTQDTEDNLKSGITVNVPAKDGATVGTATVSFDVTVNPLEGEDLANLSKEILNTALVDDNPTNEVTETVNKADVKYSKSSIPEAGSTVTANDEITYIITLDNSTGKAPATVVVKDSIPTGTTFVPGSIKVKDSSTGNSAEELASGIEVNLNAGESTTLEFKVTVNDLDDEDQIRNIATVDEKPTEETIHTYVEPMISQEKSAEILDAEGKPVQGRTYALAGDKIKYTITVTNDGGLSKDVVIKDNAPEGTTFVAGSVKVNGSGDDNYTETDLNSGIIVKVPAKQENDQGTATISFEVTVNEIEEGFTTTIENTATVDEKPTDEVITIVNKPNVIGTKESNPASGETVENGEEITYTIRLTNNGTAPDTVTVKDSIPTGTEFVTGSIKVGSEARPELTEDNLSNGIEVTVEAGNTNTLEFKVKVVDNDTLENGDKITNIATVNDTRTNSTEHTYIEPIIDATKAQTTENSLDYVVEGEKITYTITVTNTGDLGTTVNVRDNIPAGTTFVPDSIVIVENGTQKQGTFTESNLEDGIEVNVGAQNSTTITFQVTVDELPDGTYYSEIVNGAVVDEEPTNDVRVDVYKPHITAIKEAETAGDTVTTGDKITYTIKLTNEGTALGRITLKDTVPTGTTFEDGSIEVQGDNSEYNIEDLINGIAISLQPDETKTVKFTVTVNEIANNTEITNYATIEGKDTGELDGISFTNNVKVTYLKPIIEATKEATTENGLGYVVEGEKITYTITVRNDGGLGKDVIIKDEIPDGVSFVENSIKVNGQERTDLVQTDLERGIQVNVPAKTESGVGESTISFEVTVNTLPGEELRAEIVNKATVDGEETNETTNIVNKADVKAQKTSVPPSGETVEAGEEITYTITVTNDGTAPATAKVTDSIPTGTTFVPDSIRIDGANNGNTLTELTDTGIEITLSPDESKRVEFKVTVNDLDNEATIENIASVDGNSTNEVEHTYVEPIISGRKSVETENGLDYVVEGETITYTITATNTGDAEGTIKVFDQIPEGTTFVPESITVGEETRTELTQDNLQIGIDVIVPARGETTLTFQVTVNNLPAETYEGTIENIAVVDGKETNEVTEEVHKPNIIATKESDPISGSTVTAGETITYKINLNNQGTAPGEVVVKDEIPTEASFVAGSIKVDGQAQANLTAEDLANGITVSLDARENKVLEFTVTVNDLENGTTIRNIASTTNPKTSEETQTNETIHTYVEPIISSTKSQTTENSLDYVVEGEKVTYTITVTNTGDLEKNVTIQDTIPEGTTFVEGSITVNGEERADLSQTNLESGISINVPARTSVAQAGTATVMFQVTVNDLPENTYQGTITNKALVDDEETNEITEDVRKAHVRIGKTSDPASGSQVVAGQEIRYVIVLENKEGTAPSTLVVKDSIPEGTTFVEGSIRVNDTDLGNTLEDLTTNGITVDIPAGETRTVEFKVKVNDLDNGYIIKNKANIMNPETQEIKDTNEVTHEYVEAIIDAEKEMTTERGLSYVIPGEKVTYKIRVQNKGDLNTTLTVQDSIPEGTEFVEGSVLLNGIVSNVTKEQLESGIEVEAIGNSEQTISFTVTVLDGATEIKNTAIVEGTPTNETKVPVVTYEKTAEVIRQTEEDIPEGTVTTGDKIKYTIRINNLGEETIDSIVVKDTIPEGTTLSNINNDGIKNDRNEIKWNVTNLQPETSTEVSFEVTVNYDVAENKVIENVATIDDEETNKVETPYDKPEIKEESSITKIGTEVIKSTEDTITYRLTYNATIKDFVGNGKVTIVDYLPYEIDIENQNLNGGLYNAQEKKITWEEDLGTIDTYTNGDKTVTLNKEITVKYLYGEDAETLSGTIPNRVEGKLELTQPDSENVGQDKVVLEDIKQANFETRVEIPTRITVHHYIEGTNQKVPSKVYGEVVEDEIQEGYVGQSYTTSASGNVQENYQVVSNSGNITGTMTRTPIEVIYYYKLQPANIVTNTITKDGTDKIINKDDKVSYTITYNAQITDYVGNARIEIVDYLPYTIDESLSNLHGGTYNPENNTITWEVGLGRINTYTNSKAGNISITRNIEVVFAEMNYTGTSFVNRAQGKVILEETKQEEQTPEASKVTETEFVKDITVEKVWDDNNDIKENRPESVTVSLRADNQELKEVVLNENNKWNYTFTNLPKYTELGNEISYSAIETETIEGDLEYYSEPVIENFDNENKTTIRITNKYRLMNTDLEASIEKTGTEKVTSSTQEVNYNIKYDATIKDYIGASLVTIVDHLPYSIDVEKSELDGGIYDSVSNTITWTENIDHINTYENGDYQVAIDKNITVIFTNLDATTRSFVNKVNGTIDLYETEKTNTQETTYETKVEIPGNVVVKYVDKDTGIEIAESEQQIGLAGDAYTTEQKDIYGYTFVDSTNNTYGNMIEGTIEVTYYYTRTNAGGVIVHYVDEEGNKLVEDELITGKVADTYKTEQKEIPNYDFVRVEGQTEGELVEDTIEVTYIYKKIPARVIVQYLEKDNTPEDNTDNIVLAEQELIEGFSGDPYITTRKEIENFQVTIPENEIGTMTREDIYVIYYYERKPSGIVTVKYVDVDTNEEILHKVEDTQEYISYREQLQGLCGLEYSTEQKDIPYYNFVEELRPSNATGIYTEEDIEVIYYYRKQTFNLSVEKQIDRITVNGEPHSLKDGLDQIDVVASQVQETDIVVTYKIIVSNPSEIEGSTKVIESIPDFFRVADGTSTEWTENGKSLEAQVTLQPGETKELTVVLRWIRNSNNFGLQINTVVLTNISNPANYEETNLEDNTSTAEVIFSVKTGGIDTAIIIGTALIVMVGALMITIYLKERKIK